MTEVRRAFRQVQLTQDVWQIPRREWLRSDAERIAHVVKGVLHAAPTEGNSARSLSET